MSFVVKPKFPDVPKLPGVPQLIRATTAIQSAVLPIVNLGAGIAQLALSITAKPKWGIYEYVVQKAETAADAAAADAESKATQEAAQAKENAAAAAAGRTAETILEEFSVTAPKPINALPVIEATSVFRIGYMQEYTLPTNPIQDGSFATFNKIATPFEIQLRMVKSGSLLDRAKFLDDMERIGASLQLYRIVTPERTYQPVNISSCGLVREGAQGAFFFAEVDITVVEVRQVTPQYSTTQGDSGASTANAKDPSSLPTTNIGTLNSVTPPTGVQKRIERTIAPLREFSNLFTG